MISTSNIMSNKFFLFFIILFNIFLSSWNYSYMPVTEGWFLLSGKLISEGKLPYIDFYAYLTPFYYWYSFFLYVASDNLIFFSRFIGQITFSFLFLFTYKFYRINFNKNISVLVTFFSLLVYLSSSAIITYDFTHLVNLFSLISIVYIINSKNNFDNFIAGVFAALVFLTKQSNGFVIYLILAFIFILKNRLELKKIFYPFIGSLLITIIVIFPFLTFDKLSIFLEQIIFHAGNSKGGIISSLTNLFPPKATYYSIKNIFNFLFDSFLPMLILVLAYYRFKDRNITISNTKLLTFLSYFSLLFFVIIVVFRYSESNLIIEKINSFFWNKAYLWSGYYVFFLIPLKRYTKFDNYSLIFLFGLIIASATSAGLTAVSIFLHVGFALALLFHFRSIFNISFVLGAILLISIPTHSIIKKYNTGYYWWGVSSKIGNFESSNPIVSKVRNDGTSQHLDQIYKIINSCSVKPNNLLSFPHTTLVNLATGLNPPGNAITYWFDFLSNEHTAKEVSLFEHKQKIDAFVVLDVEDLAWEVHNNLFRKGKGLEQKKLKSYLDKLSSSDEYELKYSSVVNSLPFNLYLRKELECNP